MKIPNILELPEEAERRLAEEHIALLYHPRILSTREHAHRCIELSYIVDGCPLHILDGERTRLGPGRYFIVDHGSVHSFVAEDGFSNIDCLFLPEFVDPALRGAASLGAVLEHYLVRIPAHRPVGNPAHLVFSDEDGQVRRLLERCMEEQAAGQPGHLEMMRCLLVELLITTVRKIAAPAQEEGGIGGALCAAVARRYAEPLSLSLLAGELGYSLPYVSRVFREQVGVGFSEYLQRHRVMQGCHLLLGGHSIAAAAESVGYADAKFFSTLFRRYMGMSPAAYCRRMKT